MSWIKIDHNIHRHPKFRDMPDVEFVIWHKGLCYAAEFWTDGFIPASEFPRKNQQKYLFDLQKRDLWHPISQNGVIGYQIHDYEKSQTLKKDYEEKKEKDKDRKRKKSDIPDGIHDGISKDSERNPEGIPALIEEKRIEEKRTGGWPQSNTPTPIPPKITDEERIFSETPKSPMPEDARRTFEELGYR